MKKYHSSEIILSESGFKSRNSEVLYDDDNVHFSNIPMSGSMSKSLKALNTYVKKNIFYDESEVTEDNQNDDSAFFSKETSPNESVSKSDSDSLKSINSEKKCDSQTLSSLNRNEMIVTDDPTTLTDDYKFNKLLENNNINETSDFLITTYKKQIYDYDDEKNISTITTNCNALLTTDSVNIKNLNKVEEENTQNTKSIPFLPTEHNIINESTKSQIIETHEPDNDSKINKIVAPTAPKRTTSKGQADFRGMNYKTKIYKDVTDKPIPSQPNHNLKENRLDIEKYEFEICQNNKNKAQIPLEESKINTYSSLTLNRDKKSKQNVDFNYDVTLRPNNLISQNNNRHTIHDFKEWGNRTDIYPDVYAPIPYKSPSRRYVESDVNIHYRCPVRHDPLPLVPERELARQQAEHMKRLYREQRRNKYLQELQDMQNRRHQDNFMPSQKTIVPLNRYDEAEKIIAKALYTFNGQTTRELSFRKGDIINVRKQIDSNWYEGEVHGKVGLFPYNYVELLKGDGVQTLKKPTVIEGRARAKFDFTAQTNLELPLKKGEVVVLTRRIDHNWWEGRNGNKTGIFPDSYVTILQEPSQSKPEPQPILSTSKPVASPAAHGLLNGVDKRSMGAHRYTPQLNSPALSNAPPADIPLQGYITKSTSSLSASERGYGPPTGAGVDLNNTEPLYVDTNAEAVPYRAMYKYRPQNPDELELNEGDTVYVLEKCDDGWYVGSSQRTGRFGTFPGNYVERI
ncbi:unnamed protein product, partial [Brenthis ino]